jgi:aminopeptidase N
LLDAKSRVQLSGDLPGIRDPLRRAIIWNAMWDSVRECDSSPLAFLQLGLHNIAAEHNEVTLASVLANMQIALRWYLPAQARSTVGPSVDAALIAGLVDAPTAGHRITYFRALAAVAASPSGISALKDLLNNHLTIPDVPLDPADRQRILQRLALLGDAQCASLIDAECRAMGGDTARFMFCMQAAQRDAKTLQFTAFCTNYSLPDAWIDGALMLFNAPEHADLTIAHLPAALGALAELKRERKIFFVNRWLASFIGGQYSADALTLVRDFLDLHPALDPDLRRKVQEAAGELERTAAIRSKVIH